MIASQVFSIVNLIAMLMWALMIFLPKWKFTRLLMVWKVVPILLSMIYAFYIIQTIGSGVSLNFGSLASVMNLFTLENGVLAGWVHYLAFDLLVGMWLLDQNENLKLNQIVISICLFGCFMLGPIGYLLFTIIRTFKQKAS